MTMDLRHLRTFVAVAEQGTVSQAALDLRIAQPALSRQIIELERELGLKLFDRVGRRLVLTGEGEQLLSTCRGLLGNIRSLGEQAELLRRGDAGVLKVSASSVQIETVFTGFVPKFSQRYPNVEVKFIEAVSPDVLTLLERGEIHVGVSLRHCIEGNHIGVLDVPAVELLAAAHPSLEIQKGSGVDISRVASYPLLLLDTGFVIRNTFDAICRVARLKLNILIESRTPHTLLAFAEAGLGLAIIPSVVQTQRHALKLRRIIYRRKPIREPVAIVWDNRRILPRYAQDFCKLLSVHMHKLGSPKLG